MRYNYRETSKMYWEDREQENNWSAAKQQEKTINQQSMRTVIELFCLSLLKMSTLIRTNQTMGTQSSQSDCTQHVVVGTVVTFPATHENLNDVTTFQCYRKFDIRYSHTVKFLEELACPKFVNILC